ncbi:MAG: DUF2271 domain-containing protein [Candidatus Krumholzibacteria bacterium]|nr:DUF2271 domain-containing protein [Candidatus Krumholzibacteria bacterium]
MRLLICSCVAVSLLLCAGAVRAKEPGAYVAEAKLLSDAGDLAGAVALLEQAVAEHPKSSEAFAYLGLYTGMSAGRTGDMMEAGRLSMRSFELLDTAVALDPGNPDAHLFRGIMGINVPEFMGKMDGGMQDLQRAAQLYFGSPTKASPDGLTTSLSMLAQGFEKRGDLEGQREALRQIVTMLPGSDAAERAQRKLDELAGAHGAPPRPDPLAPAGGDSEAVRALKAQYAGNPSDTALALAIGQAYFAEGAHARAREALKAYVGMRPGDAEAYLLLAQNAGALAETGYDEKIHEDTNYRSGLAFEVMNWLDKAVAASPGDLGLRLMRGTVGMQMPFFLGKQEQSTADLETVAASDAPDSLRSQALFYLGVAGQREAMRYWIDVAKRYPDSEAARLVFEQMRPAVARFDESAVERPFVKIDFVLGFRDDLPPQTAVWIEDDRENYVATVYVSGFAGFVRERQVTLPLWAAVSKFEGVDGVTGASIDVGHHVYAWDCTDHEGNRVPKGTYTVRVEVSHWPSGLYQNVAAKIDVGKKDGSTLVEEGDFVPFLEVTYRK